MAGRNENLNVTLWGLWINLCLGVLKCTAGILAHSRALVADGLHSLLDLSTDLAVVYGLKMSAKPQDLNHPYGHHKFASLANLFVALALVGFCIFLIFHSILALKEPPEKTPGVLALIAALFSLVVKEWLFIWTRRVARRQNSRLLLVNAWHHRTDSLSSLIVVLIILGVTLLGPQWVLLDFLAGIVLGVFLLVEGSKLSIKACNDLLDTAPEEAIINDLREHILPTPGALGYHDFRARRVGDKIEVDLHLQVEPDLPVQKGHEIAQKVRENILRRHPEVLSVLVHVEPATNSHLKAQGVFDFDAGLGDRRDKGN